MKINNFEALNLNVNGNKQQLSNKTISKFFKQWPLAGEFSKFEYSPKIRQIFVTCSGKFGEY
jgi:hypothetical protein